MFYFGCSLFNHHCYHATFITLTSAHNCSEVIHTIAGYCSRSYMSVCIAIILCVFVCVLWAIWEFKKGERVRWNITEPLKLGGLNKMARGIKCKHWNISSWGRISDESKWESKWDDQCRGKYTIFYCFASTETGNCPNLMLR